jgi:DNA-binding transcriptional ArsR family regulator
MDDSQPDETETEPLSTDTSMTHPDESPDPLLELDEVFAALGDTRRRYLLYTLVNEKSEVPLTELAANIAAWEENKPVSEVTDDEHMDVYVSLYHIHVPKLVDVGIVDYQEAEDIIIQARNTEQVQAVLDGAGAELDSRQETHARDTDAEESR